MKQATGHEVKGKESWVCLLVMALYGTKQAAHAWQQHLKGLMVEVGFTPLVLDPATYVKREGEGFVLVGTHVDDLFVVSNVTGRPMKVQLWEHLSRYQDARRGKVDTSNAYPAGCQARGAKD